MERPFLLIGVSYLVSLILAEYLTPSIALYIIFLFLAVSILSLLIKRVRSDKVLPIVSLTAVVALSLNFVTYKNKVEPIEKLDGKSATVTATLCDLPYKSFNKYYYTLKTDSVSVQGNEINVPQTFKVRMSVSKGLDLAPYDKITCKLSFYTKEDNGAFSSRSYYRAKGINIFSYMHEYEDYEEIAGKDRPVHYYLLNFKKSIIVALRRVLLNKNAGLAQGILLGDKFNIDEDTKNNFKDIGISHLLCVSGLHISVITKLLVALFLFLKFSKKSAYIFSSVGVLLFAGVAGFTTSVIRASVMCFIYLFGKAFFKKADSLNSLGFAILFICLTNPFSGGDIGLLLSVSSTLGIILLEPKLEEFFKEKIKFINSKIIKRTLRYLLPLVCATISATIFTLPITAIYFKEVSLVSVISNILIVSPSILMFTFTLLCALFYLITPLRFLSMLFGIFSNWFLSYMTFSADLLSRLPLTVVSTNRSYLIFWLASTFLLLALLILLSKRKYQKYFKLYSLLSLVLLLSGILSYEVFNTGITSLAVLDVGNGLSLVLTKDGKSCLISCGGDVIKSSKLDGYLNSRNIHSLDGLVLDGFRDCNSLYARNILEKYNPKIVLLPDLEDIDDKISKFVGRASEALFYKKTAVIKSWGNVIVEPHYSEDLNYTVLKINDVKILVCTYCKDLDLVPEEDKDGAILLERESLKNLICTGAKYVVLSNDFDNCMKNYKSIAQNDKIPIITAGCGNLIFDFLGGNRVIVKRET